MALNSKTNLKLIDAICEGPIEGLVPRNKQKGLFLNETRTSKYQRTPEDEGRDKTTAPVYLKFRNGGLRFL